MLGSIRSGAIAGAISALSFTIIHYLFISDIWFSLPMMILAGALCGLCLGWTYRLLFEAPTLGSWLGFNAIYVGMFGLLGLASVLIFEPVSTIPELMATNGPPDQLIRQAMPMTVTFTLGMAALISLLYGRTWAKFAATLTTCIVLVALLGLNVSVIGLVSIPRSALYLVGELLGLILALNIVFSVVYVIMELKWFAQSRGDLYTAQ